MQEESPMSKFDFLRSIPNLIVLSLFALAVVILAWVGQIMLNDISVWNKDLSMILFGSRNGEAISLGMGMVLIHYLLIGISFLAVGVVFLLRNRMSVAIPQQTMLVSTEKISARTPIMDSNSNIKSEVKYTKKGDNRVPSEERFFSGCLNHFGYLSSRPKDSPIPQECIICQRLGDCMVATVYIQKANE